MAKEISIGDEVWVHGFVDEIRRDVIIIRNDGGYFGTVAEEIGYCDDYEDLTDTPQTEEICERCIYVRGSQWCQGCNGTPKRWNGEKVVDTPQTDEEYINNLPWTEKDCPWK